MATTTTLLYWLQMLLKDLHLYIKSPPVLWCDDISAHSLASNPMFYPRTKHIKIDYHFVREKVVRNDIIVKHISALDQLANIFTKRSYCSSVHQDKRQPHGSSASHSLAGAY